MNGREALTIADALCDVQRLLEAANFATIGLGTEGVDSITMLIQVIEAKLSDARQRFDKLRKAEGAVKEAV